MRFLRPSCLIPVLLLTARDTEADMLQGFDAGCDDYVTKPFSPREVAARVRAILRREARSRGTEAMEPATTWQHDAAGMRIVFRAQTLDLTRYEYLLLALPEYHFWNHQPLMFHRV